jgi:hypothetical protein
MKTCSTYFALQSIAVIRALQYNSQKLKSQKHQNSTKHKVRLQIHYCSLQTIVVQTILDIAAMHLSSTVITSIIAISLATALPTALPTIHSTVDIREAVPGSFETSPAEVISRRGNEEPAQQKVTFAANESGDRDGPTGGERKLRPKPASIRPPSNPDSESTSSEPGPGIAKEVVTPSDPELDAATDAAYAKFKAQQPL